MVPAVGRRDDASGCKWMQVIVRLTKAKRGLAPDNLIGAWFVSLLPGKARQLCRVPPHLVSVKPAFPA